MARPLNCNKCRKPKRPRGRKFNGLPGYCECGRPTKMDPIVLKKLEDAFTYAMSDRQACIYAGISEKTLYNYQKANPEFVQRKELLKQSPDMVAKKTVVSSLEKSVQDSWRWLEKRDPEFKPVKKVEHTGLVELRPVPALSEEEQAALQALREARRKRIEAESDNMQ